MIEPNHEYDEQYDDDPPINRSEVIAKFASLGIILALAIGAWFL